MFWLRFPAAVTCFGSGRPGSPLIHTEFSVQTDSCLVVRQGSDKRFRTLAHSCRGDSRTWAAGPVKIIKDNSHGPSLVLGRRLQRPTISPFLIPQPRQLLQKHLSRALQIPFRVHHRWATFFLLPINDRRTNTHSLPHCAMERVHAHRRNDAHIGFHTRFTPCLPSNVKVLFQTGNTLGFVSLNRTRNTSTPFSDRTPRNLGDSGMSPRVVCVATTLSFSILKELQKITCSHHLHLR